MILNIASWVILGGSVTICSFSVFMAITEDKMYYTIALAATAVFLIKTFSIGG
jgi:hypothetical protein